MMLDTPEGEDAPADLVSSVSATSGELSTSCAESEAEEASVPCGSPLGVILGVIVSSAGAACTFLRPSHSSLLCFNCRAVLEGLAPASEAEPPAPRLAAFA